MLSRTSPGDNQAAGRGTAQQCFKAPVSTRGERQSHEVFPRSSVQQQLADHQARLLSAMSGKRQVSPKGGSNTAHSTHMRDGVSQLHSLFLLPDIFRTRSKNPLNQHEDSQECVCAHK